MPFGSEERDFNQKVHEEKQEAISGTDWREFLEVTARVKPDGRILPVSFTWNGREYRIDHVLDCQPGHSLKQVKPGMRFSCVRKNRLFYLYYSPRESKWYIEKRRNFQNG